VVPPLNYGDLEDNKTTTITITQLPDPKTGTLYYNGQPVTEGQVIPNFDPTKLTVDPENGDQIVVLNLPQLIRQV